MRKKLIAAILAVVMVLSFFDVCGEVTADAATTVVYDANNLPAFSSRTEKMVADKLSYYKYKGETYLNGDSSSWYSVASSTKSPYNAGVLTADTHSAMTGMTDFYRWLTGANPLKKGSSHSASMQAQALDRNFEFNHSISNSSKPSDMSQEMWDEGYECTHNILAWGYTPQGAIVGWMNEGYDISSGTWGTIGHRTTLINERTSKLTFGYSGTIAVGSADEFRNDYQDAMTAFPAPGYMPSELISPGSAAWSVSFNPSVLQAADESKVQVLIRDLNNGEAWTRSAAEDTLQSWSDGMVFAQPKISEGRYKDSYSVEITGLTDVATQKPAVIKYTVHFFEASKLSVSPVVSASAVKSKFIIYKTLGDTENLKKIASTLPQEIVVTNELGEQAEIKADGAWKLDEKNSCFVNSASASNLPNNMSDPNGKLKNAVIKYEISEDGYDAYNSLGISKHNAKEGDSVKFGIYRTLMSTDSSQIFQRKRKADGTYYGVKRFDSRTSAEFDADASSGIYHYYELDPVTTDDQGEYLSIYYLSSSWNNAAYVSTSFSTLNVESAGKDHVGISSSDINVRYRTHIQTYGWEAPSGDTHQWKKNGMVSGTSGKAKRLEAINISVDSASDNANIDLGVRYTTHCQTYGWLPWSSDGEMNGTEGEAKRLEAIKIQLKGKDAGKYDIYYRVHAQSYGWLGWAKNGDPAGTAGLAKRLEAIQIVVVKKGTPAPGNTYGGAVQNNSRAYISKNNTTVTVQGEDKPNVAYQTHVQTIGWQGWRYNGTMSGTQGKAKRLEGINIKLTNADYSGGISYITHVQTYGWQGNINNPATWRKNGETSGTVGQAKRLEAICIKLTGEMEKHYDVYYRVHAQTYGWLAWTSNGKPAGTSGLAKRLEGIQIVLVPKGQQPPQVSYAGVKSTNTKSYIQR